MSRSRDLGTWYMDRLLQLRKFGPEYLDERDLSACLTEGMDAYYRFLARRLLSGSTPRFWRYQVKGLRSGGLRIQYLRLFKCVRRELLQVLANPSATIAQLRARTWMKAKVALGEQTLDNNEPTVPPRPFSRLSTPHDPR